MLEIHVQGAVLTFVEDHWETSDLYFQRFCTDTFRPRTKEAAEAPDKALFWAYTLAALLHGKVVDTRPAPRIPKGAVL